MKWLWIVLIVWGAGIVVGLAVGGGCGFVAVSAPFLPLYALARQFRRPPDWRVERALKALRASFRSGIPPIVKTYVLADWVVPTKITIYLVCAEERDRPVLDSQLDRLAAAVRNELTRQAAPEAIAHQLQLQTASKEYIDRADGFYNYIH
jgi:hypothetical protein